MTSSDRSRSYVDRKEFVEIAIRFEIDSADFYRDLQGSAADDQARELLRLLEGQERRHEQVLQGFKSKTDLSGGEILQFTPDLSLSMPPAPRGKPGFRQLFELAIERERKSEEIYHAASAQVGGDMKALLEGLAAFEREHVLRLQKYKELW
jgi:rubrerythrin